MPDIVVLLDDQMVRRLAFGKAPITIGRTDSNSLSIEDMSVSRQHARIDEEGPGRYFLTDLDSANGTLVNDLPITRTRIYHNDRIGVGKHQLLFQAPDAVPDPAQPPEAETEDGGETIVLPHDEAGEAYLTLRPGRRAGTVHALPAPVATVGRAPECDVRVVDWFVAPRQACIERNGPIPLLRPLGEPGQVRLNGSPAGLVEVLHPGDVIEMGVTRLIFSLDPAEAEAACTRRLPDYLPAAVAGIATEKQASLESALEAALAHAGNDIWGDSDRVSPEAGEASPTARSGQEVAAGDADRKGLADEETVEPPAEEAPADLSAPIAPASEPPEGDMESVSRGSEPVAERVAEQAPAPEPQPLAEEAAIDSATEAPPEALAPAPSHEPMSEPMAEPLAASPAEPPSLVESSPASSQFLAESSVASPTEPSAAPSSESVPNADAMSEKDRKALALWQRALQNPSEAVRKQAAEQIRRLTGGD